MANLTATLDTQERGKPVQDGPKEAPSLISTLANPITSFLGGLDDRERRDQNKAKAGVLNAVEGAMFDELTRATTELGKVKAGVSQGRLPSGHLDIKGEAVKERLFSLYPEHKALIAKHLQDRGFDNWEFRDLKMAADAEEARVKQINKVDDDDYEYAFKQGVGHPERPFEANVRAGRMQRALDIRLERLTKAAEREQKASSEGRAQATHEQTARDREAFGIVNENINVRLDQFLPQIDRWIAAATGDAEKEKRLNELVPLMGNWVAMERERSIRALGVAATPETVKAINERFDAVKQSLEDRFAGTLSSYQGTERAVKTMESSLKLGAADSFQLYSQLSATFGREFVNQAFAVDPTQAFGAEVLKQLMDEVKGFRTADAEKGRVHLMRLGMLLKGDLNLKDMPEHEAMKQMPSLATALKGTQIAILKGENTASTNRTWMNSYGNLLGAAVEVQPGQRDLSSVWAASSILLAPGARTVLENLIKDPESSDQGRALMTGSRGTAAHLLEVAKTSTTGLKPHQSIRFDGNKFYVHFDKQGWEKSQRNSGGGSLTSANRSGPPAVTLKEAMTLGKLTQDNLSVRNAALEHLVSTAQHDEDVPKGVTRKQLLKHYAEGVPFVSANGKPMLTSDEAFNQEINKFEEKLRTDPLKPTEKGVQISDIRFSSPVDALVRTVLLEAASEGPEGWKNVASVILNRAEGKMEKIADVVLANNGRTWQFEPWGNDKTRQKGLSYDPNSKEYQRVMAAILPLVTGDAPRSPFKNFLNKDIVAQRGDKIPEWAAGEGTKIGNHTFY